MKQTISKEKRDPSSKDKSITIWVTKEMYLDYERAVKKRYRGDVAAREQVFTDAMHDYFMNFFVSQKRLEFLATMDKRGQETCAITFSFNKIRSACIQHIVDIATVLSHVRKAQESVVFTMFHVYMKERYGFDYGLEDYYQAMTCVMG